MENVNLTQYKNSKSRKTNFTCPCGKNYKSYQHLYIHLKKKHIDQVFSISTQVPMQFPKLNSKKSSATSSWPSNSTVENQNLSLLKDSQNSNTPVMTSSEKQKLAFEQQCIKQISNLLETLPQKELNQSRLCEMKAINEMNVFLSSRSQQREGKNVGQVLTEFLESLSKKVKWIKFKQFYIFLMMYVEYMLQKQNYSKQFEEISCDSLCIHLNDFLSRGITEITEKYEVKSGQLFEKQIVLSLFFWLFKWLLEKEYISYKISLNPKIYYKKF